MSVIKFSKLCSVKQNSKFDGPEFPQKLTLKFQIFRNKKSLPKYLTDIKLKMPNFFIFEIKRAKMDKIFNFLKGCFSVMGSPMDMIFGIFSETNVRLLKNIILQFSQNIENVIIYLMSKVT